MVIVKQIINETNMQCLVIPINKNASLDGCKTIEGVGLNEFIWLIKNASIVVTDWWKEEKSDIVSEGILWNAFETSWWSQNSRLHQILGMYLLSEMDWRWSRFVRQQNIDYEKSETILEKKINFRRFFKEIYIEKEVVYAYLWWKINVRDVGHV